MSVLRSLKMTQAAVALLALCLATIIGFGQESRVASPARFADLKISVDADYVSDAGQLVRSLFAPKQELWMPKANTARPRGAAADVFAKTAPGVVVVQSGRGHGTGFCIDPSGWIITNHHVAEHFGVDRATAAQVSTVYFGRLTDDGMTLVEKGLNALVYALDPHADLALLKVALPKGMAGPPVLAIAAKTPRVGEDCFAVGHPAAGLLWTLRSGTISGRGKFPADLIDEVLLRLTASDMEKSRLRQQAASQPQRQILQSTCGVNPGDSGGPLLNKEGEVIAVTFAAPGIEGDVDLDKFTFHVHLQELQAFVKANESVMKAQTAAPPPFIPDVRPLARFQEWLDLDRDGRADTLALSMQRGYGFTGVLLDLDQNASPPVKKATPAKGTEGKTPGPSKKAGTSPDSKAASGGTNQPPKEDFEFARHHVPFPRTFYDTDDDGRMDVIVNDVDNDGRVDFVLQLEKGRWVRRDPGAAKLLDPDRFADRAQRERFRTIMIGPPPEPKKPATASSAPLPLEAPPARP